MRKLLLLVLVLFCVNAYAYQETDNYRLYIPGNADRDWLAYISQDLISVDTAIYILSEDTTSFANEITIISNDASWTKSGTNVSLITSTNSVGIGTATPTVTVDVVGVVSVDALRFDYGNTASFDTGTTIGPGLYVSKDASGTYGHLLFYNGSVWNKVSLE